MPISRNSVLDGLKNSLCILHNPSGSILSQSVNSIFSKTTSHVFPKSRLNFSENFLLVPGTIKKI